MRLGLDAGTWRKMRCGIFKKIANRAFIACAGKIFCMLREKFLAKLFWEKSGEVDHRGIEIFANGISLGSAMK